MIWNYVGDVVKVFLFRGTSGGDIFPFHAAGFVLIRKGLQDSCKILTIVFMKESLKDYFEALEANVDSVKLKIERLKIGCYIWEKEKLHREIADVSLSSYAYVGRFSLLDCYSFCTLQNQIYSLANIAFIFPSFEYFSFKLLFSHKIPHESLFGGGFPFRCISEFGGFCFAV